MAGPVGSGKTAAAGCIEMVLGAMVQEPFPDGVRRVKFGILRDTYRNLYAQFIPSWFEWFPREIGTGFKGSDDRPASHSFIIDTPLGPCEVNVEMRALGQNSVEATCRGWNLTGCFLDEADQLPEDAISFLTGRVMRWPQRPFRRTKGVWFTFNKADVDHWTYRMCVEEYDPTGNFEFFDQPSGILPGGPPYILNPLAENIERLDDDYYQLQAEINKAKSWYVKRMVRNQWGASVAGEVVYDTFNPERHIAAVELQPEPRQPLIFGMDGGGTPAGVLMGRDRFGRRIVYAEVVVSDPNDPRGQRLLSAVGPTRFVTHMRDLMAERFPRNPIRIGYGDPAAFYGADREMGEYTDMETVGQRLKIPLVPAGSNEIRKRLSAVRDLLDDYSIGGVPALIINPSCKWLRRGFVADYKYEERDPKREGKTLRPQKTATSHVHDALQYACLGDIGTAGVTAGRDWDRGRQQSRAASGEPGSEIWREIERSERANVGRPEGATPDNSYVGGNFDLWNS